MRGNLWVVERNVVPADAEHPEMTSTYAIPIFLWVIGRWLERGHPHWEWWQWVWLRLIPDWGDPFCAAFTTKWSPYYWAHAIEVDL